MKSSALRTIICVLVVVTALADILTFLVGHEYWRFEVNPVYVLTKTALVIVILKCLSISLLCMFVARPTLVKKTLYYSIILSAIYMILFQGLGAYSNFKTQVVQPAPEQALSAQAATETYLTVALVYYLIPLVLSTLAYWLHSKIYSNI